MKMSSENVLLEVLLQIGATDLTVGFVLAFLNCTGRSVLVFLNCTDGSVLTHLTGSYGSVLSHLRFPTPLWHHIA